MSARKTADLYFSKTVRARGACERCGAGPPHEAAHIIRRRYVGDPDGIGLRWNEDNAWCLCIPCHRLVDTNALEFAALVVTTIGPTKYHELEAIKNAPHRPWREADWIMERQRLAAILKEPGLVMQTTLFVVGPHPLARATDPQTSLDAAKSPWASGVRAFAGYNEGNKK